MALAMVAPVVWSALAVVALTAILHHLLTKVLWDGLWVPLRYRRIMTKQGVKSVPFRFLVGQFPEQKRFQDSLGDDVPIDSFADFSPSVVPQYALFFPKFPGEKYFLYWMGSTTRLVVRDPEIARELFISNYTSMRWSPSKNWFSYLLLGKGLSMQVGEKWSTERRVLNPFFHQNSLKGMVETISEAIGLEMIRKWEAFVSQAGGSAEIDVAPDVHATARRVLSATAFGGDFETGDAISKMQKELAMELLRTVHDLRFTLIPFYWKIPTAQNRRINELVSKIDSLLIGLIEGRLKDGQRTSSNDLLGTMLESAADDWDENSKEWNLASVFNNCKLLYFAGQDTAANATLFTMLMLALHPEWQERARNEILEVVGAHEDHLTANVLSRLKVVGMCVNETLRAFTISPSISRLVTKDMQLKELFIPRGITVEFASAVLHQDKQCWGDDAAKWNPGRFANGVAGACSPPQAFIPFGLGPRMCIGNNFALMEIKIALCKVLPRFQLQPSPNYKHYPVFALVARPKYGLPIIFRALPQRSA